MPTNENLVTNVKIIIKNHAKAGRLSEKAKIKMCKERERESGGKLRLNFEFRLH